jgi:hypothetical protein
MVVDTCRMLDCRDCTLMVVVPELLGKKFFDRAEVKDRKPGK